LKKIVLLQPECFHPAGKFEGNIEYHLGLFYIASILKKNGFKVTFLWMSFSDIKNMNKLSQE